MKINNLVFRFFFGTKLRIFLIFFPLVILIITSIIGLIIYNSIYNTYLNDREMINNKLSYYSYVINKKTHPEIYTKPQFKSSFQEFEKEGISFAFIVYDVNGEQIGKLTRESRTFVGLNNISPHFIDALIATEDRDFYNHNGISYKAIFRALVRNILAGKAHQGGSTITQQLAKILFTKSERTVKRKVYEMLVAKNIEKKYDKNHILLLYINKVYFGHGTIGVEEASKLYFKKHAKDLTISESALLAGVISNPRSFSPFHSYDSAKARHLRVLYGMSEAGTISKADVETIHKRFWAQYDFKKMYVEIKIKEKLNLAPYVVEEVRRQIFDMLKKKYENDVKEASDRFYKNEWKVYTTIDLKLQLEAQKAVKKGIYDYRKTLKKSRMIIKEKELQHLQGALVAINPRNGYISAFIGGDKFTTNNQFNRAFQAKRQTGSAFKPICFLAALDNQIASPYSLREDRYKPVLLKNGKIWKVRNYGNHYANKYITLTQALKVSSNQVAARLISEMGVNKIREIVKLSLGLDEKEAVSRFPSEQYSIALGTVDMTPLELAQVYAMFANHGRKVVPKLIIKVENIHGETILMDDIPSESDSTKTIQVVSKESSYLITEMMRYVLSPGGTGAMIKEKMKIDFELAGKTGTSQKFRDLWFTGYTPELCTVVWVGHDLNHTLSGGGGKIAGPIFGNFMKSASKIVKFSQFNKDISYNFVEENICQDSGKIAVKGKCTNIKLKTPFISGTEPSEYCNHDHKIESVSSLQTFLDSPVEEGDYEDLIIESTDEKSLKDEIKVEELNDLKDRKSNKKQNQDKKELVKPKTTEVNKNFLKSNTVSNNKENLMNSKIDEKNN